MTRAVRGTLVGLALALLFWFSLAPRTDPGSVARPLPEPATDEEAAGLPSALEPEARRSETLLPPAPVPVEPPASAPASAPSGRYAFEVLVIDDEARPVGGATVTAFSERSVEGNTTRIAIEPPSEWRTDASGRCVVRVPLPRFGIYVGLHLAAEKPGVGCSGSHWVSPETPTQVRLVLFAPAWINGRVIGADLRPATEATVHLSRENRPEGEEEGLPSPLRVDSEGRFSSEVRAGGQFEVWAEAGGQRTDVVRVHTSPGSRHEFDFWLPGALRIEGVLRDPSGKPVQGGTVRAWEQTPRMGSGPSHRRPWGTYGADTDKSGNYRIPVPAPGSYLIAGVAQGFASSLPRDVSVEEADPHPRVDLTLFEPASISGVVRGESGQPLHPRRVLARPEKNDNPMARLVGRNASVVFHPFLNGATSPDGTFDLEPLHPTGTYSLLVVMDPSDPKGGRSRTLLRGVRAGTRGLEIVIPDERLRTCAVTGVVLGPGAAGPPSEFTVSLYSEVGDGEWDTGTHSTVRGRADGRFSIDGAIAGQRYVLGAWGASPAGRGLARVDPWIARPEGNEFTLRLRPSGSLDCRVVDGAGRPVPFAEIHGGPSQPFPASQDFLPERADESGKVRIKGLEPSRYRIRAWKGTSGSEPVEVEVPEGDSMTVTLVIPR